MFDKAFRVVGIKEIDIGSAQTTWAVVLRRCFRSSGWWHDYPREEYELPVNRAEAQHLGTRIGDVVNVVICEITEAELKGAG